MNGSEGRGRRRRKGRSWIMRSEDKMKRERKSCIEGSRYITLMNIKEKEGEERGEGRWEC